MKEEEPPQRSPSGPSSEEEQWRRAEQAEPVRWLDEELGTGSGSSDDQT